jgi:hypothetical protein
LSDAVRAKGQPAHVSDYLSLSDTARTFTGLIRASDALVLTDHALAATIVVYDYLSLSDTARAAHTVGKATDSLTFSDVVTLLLSLGTWQTNVTLSPNVVPQGEGNLYLSVPVVTP